MPRQYTPDLRQADQQRLGSVHPDLRGPILKILDGMAAYGYPMFVTSTVRTDAEQFVLYQKGRRLEAGVWVPIDPVKRTGIVTDKDGTIKRSNHQTHSDGFGHAIDAAFLDDPATTKVETFDPTQPWEVYGVMGEYLGLRWLGRGPTLIDRPHLELR